MISAAKANRTYFRRAYQSGRHGWGVEEPDRFAVKFLNRLRRMVPRARLLDIGCGEGRHSIVAAALGFRVTAVDYEPLALARARRFAREKGVKGIVFRQANVLRLPAPATPFDIVFDYGCLHHQRKSDFKAYKASILRSLSPRGYYVLSVFSPRFPLFRGSRRPWHIAQGAYRRYFTQAELLDLFGREFEVLEMIEEDGGRHGFWHALFRRKELGPSKAFLSR